MSNTKIAIVFLIGFFVSISVNPVFAHGFGERYDLPVPLEMYLFGSGLAVILSFLVMGIFFRRNISLHGYPKFNLLRIGFVRMLANPIFIGFLRLFSFGILVLVISAGLLGTQEPAANIGPTMVWIISWVGLAYICALVGNVWALINPWKIGFEYIEAMLSNTRYGSYISGNIYEPNIGVWPAVILFMGFSWVELVYPSSATPFNLALLILAYSVITWTGMLMLGKDTWLRTGEIFSVIFGIFARFAPTELGAKYARYECPQHSEKDGYIHSDCVTCFSYSTSEDRLFNIRPPSVGLISNEAKDKSEILLVMALLSNVTFDGFMATELWYNIFHAGYDIFPYITVLKTLGLLSFPLMFTIAYLIVCRMISIAGGGSVGWDIIAKSFVYSLVPIAIAYHLAHFLSFLLIQGQLLIPLVSDPFGFGWDIFGTLEYTINIGIVDARFAWILSVVAIVTGHIIAVYVAHVIAINKFLTYSSALKSQLPMLILMVFYTVLSLWILAQPIIELD